MTPRRTAQLLVPERLAGYPDEVAEIDVAAALE